MGHYTSWTHRMGGGGGFLHHVLCFGLPIGKKIFFLDFELKLQAVSNSEICFIIAVLLLCEQGHFF